MKRKVLLSFGVSVLIFISTAILVIIHTYSILHEEKEIIAVSEVYTTLDRLRISYRSAINAHNHFILTANPDYLDDYRTYRPEVIKNLELLREVNYHYFFDESTIDTLGILLSRKFMLLDSTIRLKEEGRMKELIEIINHEATPVLNLIRSVVEDRTASLYAAQRYFKEKTEKEILLIITILILGFAIGLSFVVFAFYLLQKENRARRRSEKDLLRYSEELKRINWTKDMFFSIIAHDLRSPFTSLLSLFDLLSEAIAQKDISMIEENIISIEFSARRTFNLLQNLLEWSKLQSGRLQKNTISFCMDDIIKENLELFRMPARQKSIDLKFTPADFTVFADRDMIKTVIRNLVSNAIKFTNSGTIEIKTTKEEHLIITCIRDTGIGMSEEDRGKLFRIEVDPSTIGQSTEKGSGLGLILCKNFIELNEGSIWVESSPENGSVFCISLPCESVKKEKN